MKDIQFKARGFLVWGICALFFLYEFSIRTVMGTYQQPIMHDLGLTIFQFSLLSTTFFALIYGLMQLPVGIIVNRIGLKKALVLGAIICAVSSIGFAFSYSYPLAVVFRMLMGFGSAFGFVCVLISVIDWMPHRYSGIFIGLSQFIGTLGPMLVSGPLEYFSHSADIGWRFVFLCFAGLGLVLVFLVVFFVENNHEKSNYYTILHRPEKTSVSIKRIFSRIQPWYIAIFSASLYFVIEYFSENEGQAFLSLNGMSLTSASYTITIAWIGYAIGCPVFGFLSDFFQRRKIFMVAASILGVISMVSILYFPVNYLLPLLFFALGIAASGQSLGFAAMGEQFQRSFVAVGFGLNNGMITFFTASGSAGIGALLDNIRKGGSIVLSGYVLVFNILVVLFVVSAVLSIFFVKETYCKSMVDYTYLDPKKV